MYGSPGTPQDLLMLNITRGTTLWMLLMNWTASGLMVKSVVLRWQRARGRAAAEEIDDDPALDQILEIADEDLGPDLAQIQEIVSDLIGEEMMRMLLVLKRRKVDGIGLGPDLILGLGIEKIGPNGKEVIVDLMIGESLGGTIGGVGPLVMIPGIDRCDTII